MPVRNSVGQSVSQSSVGRSVGRSVGQPSFGRSAVVRLVSRSTGGQNESVEVFK